MPPLSKSQAHFFGMICAGLRPPPKGMTREQCCEYVRPVEVSNSICWWIDDDGIPVASITRDVYLMKRAESVVLFVVDGKQWSVIGSLEIGDLCPRPRRGTTVTANFDLHIDDVTRIN